MKNCTKTGIYPPPDKNWLTVVYVILLSIISMAGYGQTSCSSAILQSNQAAEHQFTSTDYWIKFYADTTFINIGIFKGGSTPLAQLQSFELYSGDCSTLNLLSSINVSDSLLFYSNLIIGNLYYLKLTQSTAVSSYLGIMMAAPINNISVYCPTACNLVANGCFDETNINVDLMSYFNNPPTNINIYNDPLFGYNVFNNSLSNVCGWHTHTGTPQLKTENLSWGINYYMFLMNYGSSLESMMTRLNNGNPINSGHYLLRFKHKYISGNIAGTKIYIDNSKYFSTSSRVLIANESNIHSTYQQEEAVVNITSNLTAYNYMMVEPYGSPLDYTSGMMGIDEIELLTFQINVSSTTICKGDIAIINTSLCGDICPEDNITLTYLWSSSPNDASLAGQETNSSISVYPTVTTTYTVTATTNLGTPITESKTITVNPRPPVPEFIGEIHTCNGISNNIITNYDAIATYNCTVYDDNMNPLGNPAVNGNNFSINWANYGTFQHWTIRLDASYGNGCSSSFQMDVFPCCNNGIQYTDMDLDGIYSNSTLSFNGTITVPSGQTLEFNNGSFVYMGGNAKIVLESGATLKVSYSTIEACGANLWDGIYMDDPNTSIEMNASNVNDAKNAIVSNNGSSYDLSDVNFVRNYKVLQVSNFTGNHPGKFSRCNFQGVTNLLYPYQNSNSEIAIELKDIIMQTELIKLGGIARSHISGFNKGILSNNSDFVAFSIDFNDCAEGVIIGGKDNSAINRRAIIGSSNPNMNCTFNGMTHMINSRNKTDIYVYNCVASNCAFGINIDHNKGSIISILNNTFSTAGQGVSINDVSSQVFIQGNNVLLNTNPGSIQIGIQVLDNINASTITPLTYLCLNNISEARYGIIASNTFDLTINDNEINLNNNPTSLALGIIHTGNNESEIANNRISSPSSINLNSSMVGIRSGIYSNLSDMSLFCSNESYYNGSGLYFSGTNTNVEIALNKVENNWIGMYFDNADIGPNPQGNAGDPWNNEWTNNMDKNNDGVVYPTVDWYHQGANPFDPTINPFSTTTGITFQSTNNGSYNCGVKCTNGPINPPGGVTDPEELLSMAVIPPIQPQLSVSQWDSVRTNKLNHLLKIYIPSLSTSSWSSKSLKNQLDSINLYPNNTDYYYKKACAIYSYLYDNQQVISLGTKSDFIYSSVYNWLDKSNIGQLKKFENAVFAGDTILSAKLLQSFSPVNQLELMKMEVLQVYNKTWSKGIFHFSSSDSATLYSIAYQNPNQSGSAVYLARNMLGLTLVDLGQNTVAKQSKISQSNTSKASHKPDIKVYPNPANELLYIELPEISRDYCIRIYTIFGQEIINVKANGETTLKVDISNLNSGIYIYSIYQNGLLINNDRFVKN
jgi:hypothetical protein